MKIIVDKAEMLKALDACRGATEKRTTIPILANYKLEASGNNLYVTATDLDKAMRVFVSADVVEAGAVTVPAVKLHGYLKLLPDGDVTLKVGEDAWLTVSQEKRKSRIAGMGADSFPEIPKANEPVFQFTAKLGEILSAANAARTSISTEETRFTLNGGLLEYTGAEIKMVATDGHRMMISKMMDFASDQNKCKVIIPVKCIALLSSLGANSTEVTITVTSEHIFFDTADRSLMSRRLTGNFPDYDRVVTKEPPRGVVKINSKSLADTLRRAMLTADERSHSVDIELAGSSITVRSALSDTGEFEESMDIESTGESTLTLKLNAAYVLDFLNLHEEVEILLYGADRAVGFRAGNDFYIVMPMRG